MSQSIVLKRSSLPGKVPDTGSLNLGEIAINTYDGKVFLKRSGSVHSVEELITTNVVNTGSITLTQTGSFGELVVTHDVNIQRDLYVSNDIIGNGDLDILGSFTASLEAGYIYVGNGSGRTISVPTSSITTNINAGTLATTGSNQFNGNQVVTGSVTATSFSGDGSGLTNINLDTELPKNGYDYNIDDAGTINDFNSVSTKYIVDFRNEQLVGTPIGQITYIANAGGSSQIIPGSDKIYFIANDTEIGYVTNMGYSGSIVGIGDPTTFSASVDYRFSTIGASALPTGVVSGSAQITALGFVSSSSGTSIPTGTISSSAQITSFGFVSGSYETTGRGILSGSISYLNLTNIPVGIVSSSYQLPAGVISGSSQLTSSYDSRYTLSGSISAVPTGTISGSAQITTFGFVSGSYETTGRGIISSSANLVTTSSFNSYTASISTASLVTSVTALNTFSASENTKTATLATYTSSLNIWTSSVATTGSNSFNGNQTITGSLTVSSIATISSSFTANSSSLTLNSGSNLYVQNNGIVQITGSFIQSGSLTSYGPNLLVGNSTITGSISISSGSITMPNRPAFRVIGASGDRVSPLTLSGSAVSVDYNEGNYFSTSTGKFTAPIAGLYHVYYNGRVGSVNSMLQVIIYKNSNVVQLMWEAPGNTGVAHFGVSGILKLAANDTLEAKVAVGTVQFDANDSWGAAYIG